MEGEHQELAASKKHCMLPTRLRPLLLLRYLLFRLSCGAEEVLHLLYCDETNLEKRDGDFFVYGGLVIEAGAAASLHSAIETIRKEAHIASTCQVKFNQAPTNLDHQAFAAVKQKIIETAIANNCVLLTTMIMHNVATSPDTARRNAINRLSYNFNAYLDVQQDHGLVLIDRFTDTQIDAHLRDKFSTGITGLPYSPVLRLDRILGFHYSAIGQSHFGSVIDIILGTLRFAVNAFCRNEAPKLSRARQLLSMLSPLFYRGSSSTVAGISLDFTPKTVKSPRYKQRYEELRNFLGENGISAGQEIR